MKYEQFLEINNAGPEATYKTNITTYEALTAVFALFSVTPKISEGQMKP